MSKRDAGKTLSLEGLRPDQAARLTRMRDEMLGWLFVGCAVDINDDYYWNEDDEPARSLEDATIYTDEAAATRAINDTIRPCEGEDSMLKIVGVYRKGDELDRGPCR